MDFPLYATNIPKRSMNGISWRHTLGPVSGVNVGIYTTTMHGVSGIVLLGFYTTTSSIPSMVLEDMFVHANWGMRSTVMVGMVGGPWLAGVQSKTQPLLAYLLRRYDWTRLASTPNTSSEGTWSPIGVMKRS